MRLTFLAVLARGLFALFVIACQRPSEDNGETGEAQAREVTPAPMPSVLALPPVPENRWAYCPGAAMHVADAKLCRQSADCSAGQQCSSEPAGSSAGSALGLVETFELSQAGPQLGTAHAPQPLPAPTPQTATTMLWPNPTATASTPVCPELPQPCGSDANCLAGQVCDVRPDACSGDEVPRCYARCFVGECQWVQHGPWGAYLTACEVESGRCQAVPCSAPESPGCAAQFACTASESDAGTAESASLSPDGCLPLLCPEDYTCPRHSECVAESVAGYPTAQTLLDDGRPVDRHACAKERCDRGAACGQALVGTALFPSRCLPEHPDADLYGCAPPHCSDGALCPSKMRCDPDHTSADVHGCVAIPCYNGTLCPPEMLCEPGSSQADANGCIVQPAMPCLLDSSCECGSCVLGRCASQPGVCVATSEEP